MLTKAPVPPPFPITGYDVNNKRLWASDCPQYASSGSGGLCTLGTTALYPFYVRYDVPASSLEMKSTYFANGYSQSGFSNVCHWGMYRVGSSLLDSALVETITVSDTSGYMSGGKTQTMSAAYPKGWYLGCILPISGNVNGSTTNTLPQNADLFGAITTIYNPRINIGVVGIAGQTTGLPSSLASQTIVNLTAYMVPVMLRY